MHGTMRSRPLLFGGYYLVADDERLPNTLMVLRVSAGILAARSIQR